MTTSLRLAALLAAALAAPSARAAGDAPLLGPLEAALLFHEWSHTPAPEERLVEWYGEVCGEREPQAHAVAVRTALEPLRAAAHQAGFTSRWRMPVRQTLGGYDLNRGGFPTSLRPGAVIRFGPDAYCRQDLSYLVVFENGAEHALVHLPKDRALDFVRSNPAREVVHELEVEVVRTQRSPEPTLVVRIVRMRTLDARRRTLVADSRER